MFEIFYHETLSEYVQDEFLDKILFVNNTWISINENSIQIGKYVTSPQRVECRMDEEAYVGSHKLQVKTLASCDSSYLQANGIVLKNPVGEDDKCLFTNYVDVRVWKASELALIPISIAMIIFVLSLWVIGLAWCITKLK